MSENETIQMDFQPELQIEIEPGKTHVLDIQARPLEDTVVGPGQETGSFEIKLVDEEGNPPEIHKAYLIGSDGNYIEVEIDEQGRGKKCNVPVGEYKLAFHKPAEQIAVEDHPEGLS